MMAGAVGGAQRSERETLYYEDFTSTTTGTLSSNSSPIIGSGTWVVDSFSFDFQSDGSGLRTSATGSVVDAQIQLPGVIDGLITVELVLDRGDTDGKWQGLNFRGYDTGGYPEYLDVWFSGTASDPNLILAEVITLKTWDLSALLTNQPVDGDTVVLQILVEGADITFYSIKVNSNPTEYPMDTHTLGADQSEFLLPGCDYWGITSRNRISGGTERFKSFKVQEASRPSS